MPFLVDAVAVSLILTPLFNAARGSLLLAALFHFQLNNPLWPDVQPYDMFVFAGVAVVVWLHRATMFGREGAVTVVVPDPAARSACCAMRQIDEGLARAILLRRPDGPTVR